VFDIGIMTHMGVAPDYTYVVYRRSSKGGYPPSPMECNKLNKGGSPRVPIQEGVYCGGD